MKTYGVGIIESALIMFLWRNKKNDLFILLKKVPYLVLGDTVDL